MVKIGNLCSYSVLRPVYTRARNMRFSVDAHSVGCHLTGNEVYIRNLLNEFAKLDRSSQFIAYVSKPDAESRLPAGVAMRWVSENPYRRLGLDLPSACARTGRICCMCNTPGRCFRGCSVVSVHDVSFLEHPQYFTRFRAAQ